MEIVMKKIKSFLNFNENHDKVLSILMGFYFLLLPFEEAFATPIGTINSLIGLFLIAYILIKYRKNTFDINVFTVSLMIWIGYLAISSLWSYYIDWWFYFFKIYLGQLVFLFVLSVVPFEKYNFSLIEKFVIFTAILVTAILVLFPDKSSMAVQDRRTIKINGTELDPNILSAIMSFGAIFTIKGVFNNKLVKAILKVLSLLIIIVGVFLTGSRGGFVGMGFAIFIYLMIELKNRKNRKKVFMVLGGIAFAAVIAVLVLPKDLIQRFSLKNLLGLTETNPFYHTRFNIWGYALESWKFKPIFGYGCGNFFRAIEITYKQCASHNMFILQLVEGGIVGEIIFLIPLIWLIYKLIKTNNLDVIPIFVFIIVMGFTLDNIQNKYFWFGLFYLYQFILKDRVIVLKKEEK